MEKLQAAIEKARERRAAATVGTASRRGDAKPADAAPPPASQSAGAWDDLPTAEVPAKLIRKYRLHFDGRAIEAGHYDRLRTKILQQCRDNGWKRVAITSATKGCGKTTTCANLAASFVRQKDRRMMLFDMDMRRPELSRILGRRGGEGFSDYLEGKVTFEDQAFKLSPAVAVSANTKAHPNPAQIILQDSTPAALEDLQARYQPDLMIFDTPPVLSTDDTVALLKHVDCALIVAAAEATTTKHVDECEREIAEQTNVLGVVLNKCKYMDQSQSYYY